MRHDYVSLIESSPSIVGAFILAAQAIILEFFPMLERHSKNIQSLAVHEYERDFAHVYEWDRNLDETNLDGPTAQRDQDFHCLSSSH